MRQRSGVSVHTAIAVLVASASSVLAQQTPATPAVPSPPSLGRIAGVLFDSLAKRPIIGARVQLAPGTASVPPPDAAGSRLTTSRSGGRFEFDSVAAGGWTVIVRDARFDSLGIAELATALLVKATGTTRVQLAVPSTRGLVTNVCGDSLARDTTGFIYGRLRRAAGTRESAAGVVRVQWLEYLIDRGGSLRRIATVEVPTGETGAFVACAVPIGGAVRIAAWSGSDSTGNLDFDMPASGVMRRELFVGASRAEQLPLLQDSAAATDSLVTATRTIRRGSAQLTGRIIGPGGQPVANARVAVHEAGLEVTSNSDGRFAMLNLPAGTRAMDVRAIGFEPQQLAVDLFVDETTTGSWEMIRAVALDTVRVRARLLGRDMEGFEERRRSGMGRFLGPEQLTRMDPLRLSTIFFGMPGVRIRSGMGGDVLLMRGLGLSALCTPQVFLDGMRMPNDGSLDGFVLPTEVRAVEVYTASFAPYQYTNPLSGCGSILIWTGPRQIPGARGVAKQ